MGGCATTNDGKFPKLVIADRIKRAQITKTYNFDKMNLTSLKELNYYLDNKEISVFSARENRLFDIPEQFFKNIIKVIKIDFSFNEFEEISEILLEKRTLNYLFFTNNKINRVPLNIAYLQNLKELDFSNNNISTLNDGFTGLINLEIFRINNNQIKEFPECLLNLEKLDSLIINNNLIEIIPNQNWEKSNIRNIDISFNKLSKVGQNFLKNSRVSLLNLKGNNIAKKEFINSDGYLNFEERRKNRKDQGYFKNLDINFTLCGLDE